MTSAAPATETARAAVRMTTSRLRAELLDADVPQWVHAELALMTRDLAAARRIRDRALNAVALLGNQVDSLRDAGLAGAPNWERIAETVRARWLPLTEADVEAILLAAAAPIGQDQGPGQCPACESEDRGEPGIIPTPTGAGPWGYSESDCADDWHDGEMRQTDPGYQGRHSRS